MTGEQQLRVDVAILAFNRGYLSALYIFIRHSSHYEIFQRIRP